MEINTIKEFNYKGFDCFINFVISEIQKVVDQLLDPEKDLRGLLDDMAWGEG